MPALGPSPRDLASFGLRLLLLGLTSSHQKPASSRLSTTVIWWHLSLSLYIASLRRSIYKQSCIKYSTSKYQCQYNTST